MFIKWTEEQRDTFAATWPCCDVPATGWAEFDRQGNLIDISENVDVCEGGGGMSQFLVDLQGGQFKSNCTGYVD